MGLVGAILLVRGSCTVSFLQGVTKAGVPANALGRHTVERGAMDPIGPPVDARAVHDGIDEGHGLALLGDGWRRVTRMTVEDATYLRALREGADPSLCPTPAPTPQPSGQTDCAELGTCTIVDDPHITVFDKAQVSLLAVGPARGVRSKDYRFGDMACEKPLRQHPGPVLARRGLV